MHENSTDNLHNPVSAAINDHTSSPSSMHSLELSQQTQNSLPVETTKKSIPKSSSLARLSAVAQKRVSLRPPVNNDPRLYSKGKKRWILACLALGSSLNGLCSTIYVCNLQLANWPTGQLTHITKDLHTNSVGMSLTTSLFILFGGIGVSVLANYSIIPFPISCFCT
ncbi:hypothetical protein J3Q64DRAFT_1715106 [Phycomyces blakesleeanus]|uniref:Major facilitator superfamily (MFS) profile domain-containing protein n=1 Tax=Phycomyces blakesleeanus TaxID=4837 RepID=A0ABR3BFX8_PHYBL